MRLSFVLCSLLFIASTGCGQSKTTVIPFTLIDNRVFITVYVNGKPLHFILDTGAGDLIDRDIALNMGLKLKGESQGYGAGDSAAANWNTEADSIRLEDIKFNDPSLLVVSLKNIKEKLNLPYLDGVIGYDFMHNYIVQFDFPAGVIRLFDKYQGKSPIAMRYHEETIPLIHIMINGIPASVMIDTGDRSYFTLFRHFANAHNIKTNADTVITGYGVGGPIMAQNIIVDKIVCGNTSFTKIPSRIPVATGGAFAETSIDGSIGTAMIKNHVMTIDYKKNVVYFD